MAKKASPESTSTIVALGHLDVFQGHHTVRATLIFVWLLVPGCPRHAKSNMTWLLAHCAHLELFCNCDTISPGACFSGPGLSLCVRELPSGTTHFELSKLGLCIRHHSGGWHDDTPVKGLAKQRHEPSVESASWDVKAFSHSWSFYLLVSHAHGKTIDPAFRSLKAAIWEAGLVPAGIPVPRVLRAVRMKKEWCGSPQLCGTKPAPIPAYTLHHKPGEYPKAHLHDELAA